MELYKSLIHTVRSESWYCCYAFYFSNSKCQWLMSLYKIQLNTQITRSTTMSKSNFCWNHLKSKLRFRSINTTTSTAMTTTITTINLTVTGSSHEWRFAFRELLRQQKIKPFVHLKHHVKRECFKRVQNVCDVINRRFQIESQTNSTCICH